MKRTTWIKPLLMAAVPLMAAVCAGGAGLGIVVTGETGRGPGNERPLLVSITGLSGEALQTLQFDLYVQGFGFTNAEAAQYQISGSADGNLQAAAVERVNRHTIISKSYSGAALRRQVHAFADDFVNETPHRPGIAKTRILFKGEGSGKSEIYVADFDGHDAQLVTRDNSLVAAPCWVPHRLAALYTSYRTGHPDIYYQDLATGARRIVAGYGGSNLSPAASPDGSRVAMILSKDGWTDLYVGGANGGDLRRLTKSPQDESSPCWSPDGAWICYASKDGERRSLSLIPAVGGQPKRLPTPGAPNPTEPDWSPDDKYIAFTSQAGGFTICVIPAEGGQVTQLAPGEDPSWAPNSRTLICARRAGGRGNYVLSLLDVLTNQGKDISRISGISSQSQPSWAK